MLLPRVRRSLITLLFLSVAVTTLAQESPTPGIIDASSFDFNENRLLLNGNWIWYDAKLLTPADLDNQQGVPVEFPSTWNDKRKSGSGQGYATYQLTVVLKDNFDNLSIDIPQIYSSYILFVDGKEIARNGTPGTTPAATVPQWKPQIVALKSHRDTLNFVLQIANFNHHVGGSKEVISIGATGAFEQKDLIAKAGRAVEVAVLLVLAIGFLLIFVRTGMKEVVIYFSFMCITWAVRSLFSNDYLFMTFNPAFDWKWMVRIEYLTLYLTMIWSILFLYKLFTKEGNKVVKYVLVVINCAFVVYTVVTDPIDFTRLLPFYLGTAGLLLLYAAGVVLFALVNERRGATYLTVSVMLGLCLFSYDIFTYEGLFSYNSLFFSIGYLIIFLLMGGALLLHLGIIKGSSNAVTMLTYKDLYGDEEN